MAILPKEQKREKTLPTKKDGNSTVGTETGEMSSNQN
jgi:hypothetical protein